MRAPKDTEDTVSPVQQVRSVLIVDPLLPLILSLTPSANQLAHLPELVLFAERPTEKPSDIFMFQPPTVRVGAAQDADTAWKFRNLL